MTFYLHRKKFLDDVSDPIYKRFDSAITEHFDNPSDAFVGPLAEFVENYLSKSCGGLYWLLITVSIVLFLDQTMFVLLFDIPAVKAEWFNGFDWAIIISVGVGFLIALYYINLLSEKDIESYAPGRKYIELARIIKNISTSYFIHVSNILEHYYSCDTITQKNRNNIAYIEEQADNFMVVTQLLSRKLLQMFVKRDDYLEYDYGVTRQMLDDFHLYLTSISYINVMNMTDHVVFLRDELEAAINNLSAIYADNLDDKIVSVSLDNINNNFFELQNALNQIMAQHEVPVPSETRVMKWIFVIFFILVVTPFISYQAVGIWALIVGTIVQIVLTYPLVAAHMISAPFSSHAHYRQTNYFAVRTKIYQTNYDHYERIMAKIKDLMTCSSLLSA